MKGKPSEAARPISILVLSSLSPPFPFPAARAVVYYSLADPNGSRLPKLVIEVVRILH